MYGKQALDVSCSCAYINIHMAWRTSRTYSTVLRYSNECYICAASVQPANESNLKFFLDCLLWVCVCARVAYEHKPNTSKWSGWKKRRRNTFGVVCVSAHRAYVRVCMSAYLQIKIIYFSRDIGAHDWTHLLIYNTHYLFCYFHGCFGMCMQCACVYTKHSASRHKRNGTESRLEYAIHIVADPRIVVKNTFLVSLHSTRSAHTRYRRWLRLWYIQIFIYIYEYLSTFGFWKSEFVSHSRCHPDISI